MKSARERILEALFDSAIDYAIIGMDLDGLVTVWNEGTHRILGWTEAEMLGRPAALFFTPDDRRNGVPQVEMQAALQRGRGNDERWHQKKDGSRFWASGEMMPLKDETGLVQGFLKILRDRTAHRAAEQRLAQSEERLNLALGASGMIGIWDWDLKTNLIYADENLARIHCVDPARALQGTPPAIYTENLHPDDRLPFRAELDRLFAGSKEFSGEYRIFQPDGSARWILARGRLVRDAAGEALRFPGVAMDITDRKTAEDALRASNAQFRTFAQAMPNHVWTSPPDGLLDWFNDRVYEYSGAKPGELDGEGWAKLVHPDDLSNSAKQWAAALASGEIYETEFRLRRADGIYRWYIARAAPIRDETGEVLRWIGTNTDIEDRKAAEEALSDLALTLEQRVERRTDELLAAQDALRQSQKMESIGNLTGGVAHDFNNLLQVISGNLQLLAKEIVGNETAERRVRNAMTGVSRGSKLASQLLAFSRKQPLSPKVVNVGRFIRNIDDLLRRALGEGIEVETIVADGLWNTLIDPSNVESALLNLAINARDAMDGNGRLTVEAENALLDKDYAETHAEVTPGQYVLLAVTDTGCGMSADIIEQVYEPFFTTKPAGKGTGLGLSMVYGFVKQSGGHIKIYSEPGHGTAIKLYLPRSTEAEDVLIDPEAAAVMGGTETILVAEDDESVREIVVAMLSDLGYRVLTARDAQSALTILEDGAVIDVLFTDVVMPGALKSRELARRAQERLPNLSVLFTSGYTENAVVHAGRLDEGIELLSKPYTREALARKLRHLLRNATQRALSSQPVTKLASEMGSDRPGPSGGFTVLLCEDDWLIRISTVDMLQELGHTVVEATNAKDALAILATQPIDILITDVGLPDMSGAALAERARSQIEALPVIFATGHDRVEGVAPGPSVALIAKPYTIATLANAIAGIAKKEV